MSSSSDIEAIHASFLENLRSGLGLSALIPDTNQTQHQDGVAEDGALLSDPQLRDRISRFFVQTRRDLQNLLRELPKKRGLLPASKASIAAMPSVEVAPGGGDCSICLDDLAIGGGGAKSMPCMHRFHGDCIEKWLGIRRSCPECRYQMPVDEEDELKEKDDASDDGGEEIEGGTSGGIRVRFVFGEFRREETSFSVSASEDANEAEAVEEEEEEEEGEEEEGDEAQDMEF